MIRAQNASLKHLNSFSVDARADRLLTLGQASDLDELFSQHIYDPQTDLVLGGGSNVLFANDVQGSVILNRITGKHIIEDSGDEVLVEVNGGENWHQLVLWSLEQGLSGIENLSLIPGLAGAAPMQNIGAYGVELADVLDSVLTRNLATGEPRQFRHDECQFGYRDSRFKSADAGHFLITGIRLQLSRVFKPRLDYAGVRGELDEMGVSRPDAKQVSQAVIRLRQRKLPDPAVLGNAGSFFKNPVVARSTAEALQSQFFELPVYPLNERQSKVSAAWLIDNLGWKGHREGDAGVSPDHALVLVNYGRANGQDLLALATKIMASVYARFGIQLVPEPKIIGSGY